MQRNVDQPPVVGQFDRTTAWSSRTNRPLDMDQVATSRQRNDPHLPRVVLAGPVRPSVKINIQAGRSTMKAGAALRKEADAGDCWKGFQPGAWLTSLTFVTLSSATSRLTQAMRTSSRDHRHAQTPSGKTAAVLR